MFFDKPRSLKSKLILYFLLITIIPSSIISLYYYNNSKNTLEKNMISDATSDIVFIMNNIDMQLKRAENLSDFLFMNKNLDKLLLTNQEFENKYVKLVNVYELIEFQVMNSPVGKYISSLIYIRGSDIDIRFGSDVAMIDSNSFLEMNWIKKSIQINGRIYWPGIIQYPVLTGSTEKYILPIARPVATFNKDIQVGWNMIGYKTTLISDILLKFENRDEDNILILDQNSKCIFDQKNNNIYQDFSNIDYIKEAIVKENGYLTIKIDGANKLVVFHKSSNTGWIILEILSYNQLNQQKSLLLKITLGIISVSIFICFVFTFFLSSNITYPFKKLLKRMDKISKGGFERDITLEREDEMGILGKGINEMACNIKELMGKRIADEEEKRILELKVLQNQVNPHFLYNTLNSIKMMAMVQKTTGISEMATALGKLLKEIARGTSEKITLKEEFDLLEDYAYIQNIRYKGKIRIYYHIEDMKLLEYKIIKFTLQPIVENAIFHGIEPKRGAGEINITCSSKEDTINICISDDGIGMSENQIKEVLSNKKEDNARGLSGIGVNNVNERIKLTYGRNYGLKIESQEGEYTKIIIEIPMEN